MRFMTLFVAMALAATAKADGNPPVEIVSSIDRTVVVPGPGSQPDETASNDGFDGGMLPLDNDGGVAQNDDKPAPPPAKTVPPPSKPVVKGETVTKLEAEQKLVDGKYVTYITINGDQHATFAISEWCTATVPVKKNKAAYITCERDGESFKINIWEHVTKDIILKTVREAQSFDVWVELMNNPERLAEVVVKTETFDRAVTEIADERINALVPLLVKRQFDALRGGQGASTPAPKPPPLAATKPVDPPAKEVPPARDARRDERPAPRYDRRFAAPPATVEPAPLPVTKPEPAPEPSKETATGGGLFGDRTRMLRFGVQANASGPWNVFLDNPYAVNVEGVLELRLNDAWFVRGGLGFSYLFDSKNEDGTELTTIPGGVWEHIFAGYSVGFGAAWSDNGRMETSLVFRQAGNWQTRDLAILHYFRVTENLGLGGHVFFTIPSGIVDGVKGLHPYGGLGGGFSAIWNWDWML